MILAAIEKQCDDIAIINKLVMIILSILIHGLAWLENFR